MSEAITLAELARYCEQQIRAGRANWKVRIFVPTTAPGDQGACPLDEIIENFSMSTLDMYVGERDEFQDR